MPGPWFYEGKILVPKNDKGQHDCEYGIESTDVDVFSIEPSEYSKLYDTGIISALNMIDGVMVDQYEGDFIPLDKLSECISVFREFGVNDNSNFLLSLKTGLNNGYGIYTEF